tara:strand:+ start:15247 stop:15774 length:528 start_codon:yes stop_codon:yes gene_type:complete
MSEPVTFAEAAAHLKLGDDTSEQALVEGYITAAREWVEDYTGHLLVKREVEDCFDRLGSMLRLSKRPVVAVTEVAYVAGSGEATSYTDYVARIGHRFPGQVFPATASRWPALARGGTVCVRYDAGFDVNAVPRRMIQAVLLLTGEFYKNREAGVLSPDAERAAGSLLRSFKYRTL